MVLNELYTVMATDALTTSHPLSFREDEINTPAQISEVFDSIAYSKVGAQRAPARGAGGWERGELGQGLQGGTGPCARVSPAVSAGSVGAADALRLPHRGRVQGGVAGEDLSVPAGHRAPVRGGRLGRQPLGGWCLPGCLRLGSAPAHESPPLLSRSPTSIPTPTETPSTQTCGSTCRRYEGGVLLSAAASNSPSPFPAEAGQDGVLGARRGKQHLLSPMPPAPVCGQPPWHQGPTANFSPQAVDNRNVSLPGNISTIMDRWTLQMGFPVVTVDTTTGRIQQKHFLLDPTSTVERPSNFK